MSSAELIEAKAVARKAAYAARAAVPEKESASARVIERLTALDEFNRACTQLWYLHIRSEVRTLDAVRAALETNRRIAIPYCDGPVLKLWHLTDFAELEPGRWNILEPLATLRGRQSSHLAASDLDAVVVPGVAFTEQGMRLGNGAGYYDRLLANTPALRVAVAFENQIYAALPVEAHDLPMDFVITESRVIRTGARQFG
ncbi:MAG: 5-formyltetrahydrofolate cyclo-ligase [Gammaproteobacteria bacterium]|nr:5-formyltetrahydrofolate cyclo-ligase [Gammaproteobacteria bacterium]